MVLGFLRFFLVNQIKAFAALINVSCYVIPLPFQNLYWPTPLQPGDIDKKSIYFDSADPVVSLTNAPGNDHLENQDCTSGLSLSDDDSNVDVDNLDES